MLRKLYKKVNAYKNLLGTVDDNTCDAFVMFSDSTSLWWLKFLKKDYRHCFVIIKCRDDWVVYEPLLYRTEITIIKDAQPAYIRDCFERIGCEVIPCKLNRSVKSKRSIFSMFMFGNCVISVSKVLGINFPWVLTPYQLYKCLS